MQKQIKKEPIVNTTVTTTEPVALVVEVVQGPRLRVKANHRVRVIRLLGGPEHHLEVRQAAILPQGMETPFQNAINPFMVMGQLMG